MGGRRANARLVRAWFGLGAIALALMGCPPTTTPQSFDLIISEDNDTSNPPILFEKNVTPGIIDTNFAFSGSDLPAAVSQKPTAFYPFVTAQFSVQNPDTVTFSTSQGPVTLQRRYETDLMLRDPTELHQTLIGDSGNFQWPADAATPTYGTPWTLPDALTMPFPSGSSAHALVLNPVAVTDFWPAPGPYAGPAPQNGFSLKAINIWEGGLCSREVPLQPFLDQITQGIHDSFLRGVCDTPLGTYLGIIGGGETTGDARQVNATVQSRHIYGFPGSVRGGFMVNVNAKVSAVGQTLLGFDDCYVDTVYTYDIDVTNGLVSITNTTQDTFNSGTDPILCHHPGTGVNDTLSQALGSTLPNTFNAIAAGMQSFNRDDDPLWACDPSSSDPCLKARAELQEAIAAGGNNIGVGPDMQAALQTAVASPTDWHCDERTIGGDLCQAPTAHTFNCDFTVRGSRVNVRPDAIEFVLFDATGVSSAFAIFVASFAPSSAASAGGFDVNAWRNLCTKQGFPLNVPNNGTNPATNFFARRFATSFQPDTPCPTNGSNPAPYAPPFLPRVQCPCGDNSDCFSGSCGFQAGDSQLTYCQYQCVSDLDCPQGQQCYFDRNLCGAANGDCGLCHPWEYCGQDSHQNAQCFECGNFGEPCCAGGKCDVYGTCTNGTCQ